MIMALQKWGGRGSDDIGGQCCVKNAAMVVDISRELRVLCVSFLCVLCRAYRVWMQEGEE